MTTQAETELAGEAGAWRPGEHVLWRYRANGPGGAGGGTPVPGANPGNGADGIGGGSGAEGAGTFHICRPVTVVRDTAELLAVWMAPDTECVKPELADGTPVHEEPLATRYTKPRTTVRCRWLGAGVLKLARPGEPWSVWLFWEQGWRFKNWYVNLEEPRTRWAGGVDSEDHFLDIAVYPDRSWEWRDEDEFAQAQQAGLLDPAQAERVRSAGRDAARLIRRWGHPFCEDWPDWRPDPSWRVPALPPDWDRPAEPEGRAARPRQPRRRGPARPS